jgi:hypothetical protein
VRRACSAWAAFPIRLLSAALPGAAKQSFAAVQRQLCVPLEYFEFSRRSNNGDTMSYLKTAQIVSKNYFVVLNAKIVVYFVVTLSAFLSKLKVQNF